MSGTSSQALQKPQKLITVQKYQVWLYIPGETDACFKYCSGYQVVPEFCSMVNVTLHTAKNLCLQRQTRRSLLEFPKEPQTPEFLRAAEDPEKKKKKRQECSAWALLWDQHHIEEKNTRWKHLAADPDWNCLLLLELFLAQRGKEKCPSLELTQWSREWHAKLAPWSLPATREFATVQMFVVVMEVLAKGFSGLCQWLLELELPFSLSHSVSERTKLHSRKYLIKRKNF